jgi:hypothetical protein
VRLKRISDRSVAASRSLQLHDVALLPVHWRHLAPAAVLAVLCACCPSGQFAGDGTMEFQRCWPFANYAVAFSPMSLREPASRMFSIHTLPRQDAVLGFTITTPAGMSCDEVKRSAAGTVVGSVALRHKSGDTVVQYRERLANWVWNYALVPNQTKAPAPAKCFVYSRTLTFTPTNTQDLYLEVATESGADTSIVVTPTLKSYAVYAP